jgi:hypothetical protein
MLNPKRGLAVGITERPDPDFDPVVVLVGARIREARIGKGLTLTELPRNRTCPKRA